MTMTLFLRATKAVWILSVLTFLCFSVSAQELSVQRQVAVTFDDLPGSAGLGCDHEAVVTANTALLQHVSDYAIPAVGFVNEGRPCPETIEDVLQLWVDAGLELGNHTATHPDINHLTVEEYTQNIRDGEPITRRLMNEAGMSLRYFRHPYLHTGNTEEKKAALEAYLAENGYTIAPVTIDNSEWLFARAYARAKADGDEPGQMHIVETYVTWLNDVVAHFEAWSVEVVGYELPQILLLHANELNAAAFGEVASMLTHRGYQFITLEEALRDPAYDQPDTYVGEWGISWLHRWARGKGMETQWEPDAPDWISSYGD